MERLYSEVCTLRHAVKLQADICGDLSSVTATIDSRISAVELRLEPNRGLAVTSDAGVAYGNAYDNAAGGNGEVLAMDVATSACDNPVGAVAKSPKWSLVVKQGRAQRINTEGPSALLKQRARKPARRMVKPIIGTAAQGNIKVVRTKLVSVFATKFLPDLETETLSGYLSEQLGRDVNCQRIVTMSNRYSLFKVCAECNEVAELDKPEL